MKDRKAGDVRKGDAYTVVAQRASDQAEMLGALLHNAIRGRGFLSRRRREEKRKKKRTAIIHGVKEENSSFPRSGSTLEERMSALNLIGKKKERGAQQWASKGGKTLPLWDVPNSGCSNWQEEKRDGFFRSQKNPAAERKKM